ncbi:hypothetical protein [Nesterenkonia flava]|uniref:Uncharacterized protein n=1 Tax=Nesterenkonia flava TaxID=469799 RepID=A0ABU1FS18_9MICC|nr:hypothetical protein [Nesterenkonia flava]MDR5711122.1 hypothetical protein [Nesterenkonia flava]
MPSFPYRSRLSSRTLALTTAAFVAALMLSSCDAEPEAPAQELGGGPVNGTPQADPAAPAPSGSQLSHDRMREVLEEHGASSTTDTDNYWADLRDLQRELHKLQVDPASCKQTVVSAALPVPDGALMAHTEEPQELTVYTFQNAEAAAGYVELHSSALGSCSSYTVTRPGASEEGAAESSTDLERVEVRSGAQDALALQRTTTTGETSERALVVVLRYDSHVVSVSQEQEAALGEDEAEAAVVVLEAEAATILSELTGETIEAPEPEPEEDEEESSDDDGSEDSGTTEDPETAEDAEESESSEEGSAESDAEQSEADTVSDAEAEAPSAD